MRTTRLKSLPTADNLVGPQSQKLFAAAMELIPGGVNSPVRAWKRLGGNPPIIGKGKGAYIYDADKKKYIDYVLSWGPLLHGHAHPAILKALREQMKLGTSFGAPTAAETTLASVLCKALPSIEQVRLVSSGTEACMSALRLARAATKRDLIIKCDGCYHGHADYLLVAAGSGAATLGQPDSAGVPQAFAETTVVVPYNNADAMEAAFKAHPGKIAAVILEPVAGNMGLVLPVPGWLERVRKLCTAHGALLVFDEVMTGFRCAWGGYQNVCKVTPDLTVLGKVIGGGLPCAAYGGRRDLMAYLAPLGPCYQAGTLSGNPLAVAAGLANLKLANGKGFYSAQSKRLGKLIKGISERAARQGVNIELSQAGTMWGYFFADRPVTNMAQAGQSNLDAWKKFTTSMIRQGIYLAPSPFEAAFFSSAHSDKDIATTLKAAEIAFEETRAL